MQSAAVAQCGGRRGRCRCRRERGRRGCRPGAARRGRTSRRCPAGQARGLEGVGESGAGAWSRLEPGPEVWSPSRRCDTQHATERSLMPNGEDFHVRHPPQHAEKLSRLATLYGFAIATPVSRSCRLGVRRPAAQSALADLPPMKADAPRRLRPARPRARAARAPRGPGARGAGAVALGTLACLRRLGGLRPGHRRPAPRRQRAHEPGDGGLPRAPGRRRPHPATPLRRAAPWLALAAGGVGLCASSATSSGSAATSWPRPRSP
jgi:hypothetical protein